MKPFLHFAFFFFPEEQDIRQRIQAMQHAPDQKLQTVSVPESADQENDHHIYALTDAADPVASQGDVDIVPQPVA